MHKDVKLTSTANDNHVDAPKPTGNAVAPADILAVITTNDKPTNNFNTDNNKEIQHDVIDNTQRTNNTSNIYSTQSLFTSKKTVENGRNQLHGMWINGACTSAKNHYRYNIKNTMGLQWTT